MLYSADKNPNYPGSLHVNPNCIIMPGDPTSFNDKFELNGEDNVAGPSSMPAVQQQDMELGSGTMYKQFNGELYLADKKQIRVIVIADSDEVIFKSRDSVNIIQTSLYVLRPMCSMPQKICECRISVNLLYKMVVGAPDEDFIDILDKFDSETAAGYLGVGVGFTAASVKKDGYITSMRTKQQGSTHIHYIDEHDLDPATLKRASDQDQITPAAKRNNVFLSPASEQTQRVQTSTLGTLKTLLPGLRSISTRAATKENIIMDETMAKGRRLKQQLTVHEEEDEYDDLQVSLKHRLYIYIRPVTWTSCFIQNDGAEATKPNLKIMVGQMIDDDMEVSNIQ